MAVENVVGEAGYPESTNAWGEFNAIPIWSGTHFFHRSIKGRQIPGTQANLAILVIGDVLKMLRPRSIMKVVIHLSKAFA